MMTMLRIRPYPSDPLQKGGAWTTRAAYEGVFRLPSSSNLFSNHRSAVDGTARLAFRRSTTSQQCLFQILAQRWGLSSFHHLGNFGLPSVAKRSCRRETTEGPVVEHKVENDEGRERGVVFVSLDVRRSGIWTRKERDEERDQRGEREFGRLNNEERDESESSGGKIMQRLRRERAHREYWISRRERSQTINPP